MTLLELELLKALMAITERYTDLVNSGDCGGWNPESEPEVMQARAAIARAAHSSQKQEGSALASGNPPYK